MSKVTPYLWFKNQAEPAAKTYVKLFKNSKITDVIRNEDGSAFMVIFKLDGREFMALNGGTHYKMCPAFSMYADCKDQKEVDKIWNVLSKGGKIMQCGWLTDKFGLTWQVIPEEFTTLASDSDPEKAGRVFAAMMKMKKLDVKKLRAAHAGK